MGNPDITAINTLITTTIDSANGFEEAARKAKESGLATQFADLARDRWEVVANLEAEVRRLGGSPKQSGSAKAAVHRRWLDAKNAVSGSDSAIIQEVENGETYLITKYEAGLATGGLSETTRRVIEEAFASVRRSHERVRGLALTVGTTDAARETSVDWARVGKSLGIAVAVGGAAFAATRVARSRRSRQDQPWRRGATVSIDRTDRTEIEARNAEGTGTAAASTASNDTDGTTATTRSGGRRSSRADDSVRLAAAGSTGSATGSGAGFQASGGATDMLSGGDDTGSLGGTAGAGSMGSSGGTGGDFGRS